MLAGAFREDHRFPAVSRSLRVTCVSLDMRGCITPVVQMEMAGDQK